MEKISESNLSVGVVCKRLKTPCYANGNSFYIRLSFYDIRLKSPTNAHSFFQYNLTA